MTRDKLIISHLTLRKLIGLLGITLPGILVLYTVLVSNCGAIQPSVSDYYFTSAGDLFVGIMCSVSLFLLVYKGYDLADNIITSSAGIFGLLVAFFPARNDTDGQCRVLNIPDNDLRIAIHFISAAIFFILLACMSYFQFTKSKSEPTESKMKRNKVYRVSGIAIVTTILLLFLITQITYLKNLLSDYQPVFWLEWIALFAFGVSWLVKGEAILGDSEDDSKEKKK